MRLAGLAGPMYGLPAETGCRGCTAFGHLTASLTAALVTRDGGFSTVLASRPNDHGRDLHHMQTAFLWIEGGGLIEGRSSR